MYQVDYLQKPWRICAVMAQGIKSVIGGLNHSKEPTMIKCHEILFIRLGWFHTMMWLHKLDCTHWSYHQPQQWKILTCVMSQHCFTSLETNKHQNLICKCCEWGPWLGSTSHCRSLACERPRLYLFILLKIRIAVDFFLFESLEYDSMAVYVFSLLWRK